MTGNEKVHALLLVFLAENPVEDVAKNPDCDDSENSTQCVHLVLLFGKSVSILILDLDHPDG